MRGGSKIPYVKADSATINIMVYFFVGGQSLGSTSEGGFPCRKRLHNEMDSPFFPSSSSGGGTLVMVICKSLSSTSALFCSQLKVVDMYKTKG